MKNSSKSDANLPHIQLQDPLSPVNSNKHRLQSELYSLLCVQFTFGREFTRPYVVIVACRMKKLKSKNDPLPITSKFCCHFELQPSVTIYIFGEFLVWTLLLLTSLNLELKCLDTTDLSEFHAVLDENWYYNLIFGQPDPIPHDNARCE